TTAAPQPLPVDPNLPPVDKSVDLDGDGRLSLAEVQYAAFVHHGLSGSVVQGMFTEVDHNKDGYLDSAEFNDIRAMVLAKAENAAMRYMQASLNCKSVDTDKNKLLSLPEAQAYILKEHGIGDVVQMFASVDDNNDGELNAPEFADFERIVRARAVETSKKALRVVDTDASNTLTMDEARRIAFEHYGFDENVLTPFFDQADENEDGQLDAVEFAGIPISYS
ncbi:EF hand, partial [Cooperia oncophora]